MDVAALGVLVTNPPIGHFSNPSVGECHYYAVQNCCQENSIHRRQELRARILNRRGGHKRHIAGGWTRIPAARAFGRGSTAAQWSSADRRAPQLPRAKSLPEVAPRRCD